jgi:hypothetical protein
MKWLVLAKDESRSVYGSDAQAVARKEWKPHYHTMFLLHGNDAYQVINASDTCEASRPSDLELRITKLAL